MKVSGAKPKIELNGWQTVKDYAKNKGYSLQTVTNWIYRDNGKLNFMRVKELNNIILVRENESTTH